MEAKTFMCPNCGEPVIEGQKYCRSCNTWFVDMKPDESPTQMAPQPQKAGGVGLLVTSTIILGFLGFCLLLLGKGAFAPVANIMFVMALFLVLLLWRSGECRVLPDGVSAKTAMMAAGSILVFGIIVYVLAKSPAKYRNVEDLVGSFMSALKKWNLWSLALAFTVPLSLLALGAGRRLSGAARFGLVGGMFLWLLALVAYFAATGKGKSDASLLVMIVPIMYMVVFFFPLAFLVLAVSGRPLGNWGMKPTALAVVAPIIIMVVGFYLSSHPYFLTGSKFAGFVDEKYIDELLGIFPRIAKGFSLYILPIMAILLAAVHAKGIGAFEKVLPNGLRWSHVVALLVIVWGLFILITQDKLTKSMALYFTLPLAVIYYLVMEKKELTTNN